MMLRLPSAMAVAPLRPLAFAGTLLLLASALLALLDKSNARFTADEDAWVPVSFEPPLLASGPTFLLKPLGAGTAQIDYDAYMSSIEHLHRTYSPGWPNEKLTLEDQSRDMVGEAWQFENRRAFDYSVQTTDGMRERGCLYIKPGTDEYDAMVSSWVTEPKFEAGFQEELLAWAKDWIATEFPFRFVVCALRRCHPLCDATLAVRVCVLCIELLSVYAKGRDTITLPYALFLLAYDECPRSQIADAAWRVNRTALASRLGLGLWSPEWNPSIRGRPLRTASDLPVAAHLAERISCR